MKESLKAKMELAAQLLNEDGTVTPTDNLPVGFLLEESAAGLEVDFQEVLAELAAQVQV